MKVNPLFGVFLSILGCGESPDSFSIRGTDEDTDIETDSHSNTERESTEIYESDTTPRISSDIDKETDMDTLENTDMDTDTDMVTETDNDICTDTDMDVETDTDVYEDTDADTDTDDIHAPLCQLDDPIQTDFVCQDQPDDFVSNNCPFDMNNQHYGSCCLETLWVCPLVDSVDNFRYNNYQTEWTICQIQNGTPVCPEFYVCVQVDGFGRQCV